MDTKELLTEWKAMHAENLKNTGEVKRFAESAVTEMKNLGDAAHANKTALETIGNRLADLEQKVVRGGMRGGPAEHKSAGQIVAESDQLKAYVANGYNGFARIQVKTLQTIGSGAAGAGGMIAPDYVAPVALPRQRLTIRDLLAPGRTTGNAIWFAQMTARQNMAATVAENAMKPQSDFTMQVVQTPVATIATWIQASKLALEDAAGLQSIIDAELNYDLKVVEENQLLNGDGTGSNLKGLIPQATAYSAPFAVTDETLIDRVLLGLIQAELTNMPATGIVLNTVDWGKARMTKDGQGRYLLGDPAAPTPPYLWGLPVVWTPAIAAGTFMVGAFAQAAQIFDRMDAEVVVSTENGTNFVTNQVTIRAEERLAMAVKVPQGLVVGPTP